MARAVRGHEGRIQKGIGKGLEFNACCSNAGYLLSTSEPQVQRTLANLLKPGMVFYDVGANVGFLSIDRRTFGGTEWQVVAFEPVPEHASAIARNAELNGFGNVIVRAEAISSQNTEAAFLVSNDSVTSKLADERGIDGPPKEIIQVKVSKLDSVDGLPHPNVIKIDAEGSEAEVLRGAESLIRKTSPVLLIELHGEIMWSLKSWRNSATGA